MRITPSQRYREDPTFRAVVDSLEVLIHNAQLTPFEIREAAMLAAVHFELRSTKASNGVILTAEGKFEPGDDMAKPPPVLHIEGHRYKRI